MLTDKSVRALTPPEKGQRIYRDSLVKGFGVRVSPGGAKTFVLMHGPKRKLTGIGRVGMLTLAEARQKARKILAAEMLGQMQEESALTVPDALDVFLKAYEAKNKASTARETERLLRKHLQLQKRLAKLTTSDITKIVDAIEAKSEAQHFFVAARTFCNWLVKCRHIPSSPMAGLDLPYRPKSRERVLDDKELVIVWRACEGDYGDLIRLLILTGQRVGQFVNLRSSFIARNERVISWPAELMKGNRPHQIPYGELAARIIEQRFRDGLLFTGAHDPKRPFTSFSSAQRRLADKCKLPHWTVHDIRRSVTTQWAGPLSVPPFLCEVMLAHKSGEISGVHAIYNKWSYLPQLRDLIERWETRLESLLSSLA